MKYKCHIENQCYRVIEADSAKEALAKAVELWRRTEVYIVAWSLEDPEDRDHCMADTKGGQAEIVF